LKVEEEDFEDMFFLMDRDQSGTLSSDEFVTCIKKAQMQDLSLQMMFLSLQVEQIRLAVCQPITNSRLASEKSEPMQALHSNAHHLKDPDLSRQSSKQTSTDVEKRSGRQSDSPQKLGSYSARSFGIHDTDWPEISMPIAYKDSNYRGTSQGASSAKADDAVKGAADKTDGYDKDRGHCDAGQLPDLDACDFTQPPFKIRKGHFAQPPETVACQAPGVLLAGQAGRLPVPTRDGNKL